MMKSTILWDNNTSWINFRSDGFPTKSHTVLDGDQTLNIINNS